MESFGSVISKSGIEFINLYSDDNRIINDGEYCYFLYFNLVDYHYPMVGKGVVISSDFTNGMSKEYIIELKEIKEERHTIDKFMVGKPFGLYEKSSKLTSKKTQQLTYNFDFANNLFKIDSFFVRDSIEKVLTLRDEYISIIRRDLTNMLNDLNSIKNGNDI